MRIILRRLGFLLLTLGILAVVGSYISAQDGEEDNPPEYVGIRECAACHRDIRGDMADYCEVAVVCHAEALLNVAEDQAGLVADFSAGEEVRQVQFPGEDEPRAFTAADITFAMGTGRYVQRYVYQNGDQYLVLPAEWNVIHQQWEPLELAATWPDPAFDWGENCSRCHTTGLTSTDPLTWVDDGVVCEACHGPGSNHVALADEVGNRPSDEELAAVRNAIVVSPDPQICGQCHSQGSEPDGNHPFPLTYRPGTELLDPAVYALVPNDSGDHWWLTGHAKKSNMQYNEWLVSGHANALTDLKESEFARDECLACHSGDYRWNQQVRTVYEAGDLDGEPPPALTVETAQFGITCITCHDVHSTSAENDFFLVNEPYALCTECHSDTDTSNGLHHPVQQMFEGTLEVIEGSEAIPSAHFTAENGPECITCHMPRVPVNGFTIASHTLQNVPPASVSEVAVEENCATCHAEQASPEAMQTLIDDTQAGVQARLEAARTSVGDDAPEWVSLALDFVEGDGSRGIHNYAYTDALLRSVETELGLAAPEVASPDTQAPPATTSSSTDTDEDSQETTERALSVQAWLIMAAALALIGSAAWVFFVKQKGNAK